MATNGSVGGGTSIELFVDDISLDADICLVYQS
jgi:hypothetical protein